MADTEFGCLPTIIGGMPHTDPASACSLITRYLKDVPAWPQLPKRSFLENMYVQFSESFPGVVVKEDRIYVDRSQDLYRTLEQLYAAYLENDVDKYPVSQEYAAGLHYFLALNDLSPRAVKGQITGPITWGLTVNDDSRRAVLYDDGLADAVAKLLRLKAGWQEKKLKEVCDNTIIFVDEPYMAAFGSIGFMLSKEKVVSLLEEVFGGISGLKGIHCCGNTDWSILLDTSVDIASFDAYSYAQSLSLYPVEVKDFLGRGGAIAWGIVPNDEESLDKESVASLKDRLEEAMAPFARKGVRFKRLIEQSLLTPSCSLAPLATEEAAARALELLVELSSEMRARHL
jgi:methionine synthase II (cobalamin-independent)